MKITITCQAIVLLATTVFSTISYGQANRSIDEKGLSGKKRPVKKNKVSVFISSGNASVPGKIKDSLFIGNGWNIESGVYVPLFSSKVKNDYKDGDDPVNALKRRCPILIRAAVGIEAGFNYSHQKADGGASTYSNSFHLQDGVYAPAYTNGVPYANLFQIFAGPRAEWGLGNFYLSPSLLLGYLSLKQNSYALSGTVTNPKQTTESVNLQLVAVNNLSASGFAIKPAIEFGYNLTSNVSVFMNGSILFGPSVQNNFNYWKPQGQSNNGYYTYDQFANGTAKSTTINTNWQALSLNAGIKYTWIKHTFNSSGGKGK